MLCICIIWLLTCAFEPAPAPAAGKIEGKVCELDGCSPIEGVRVVIELPNSGGVSRTAITDAAGGFRFSQLPPGRYVLEAEAEDFLPVAALPLMTITDGGRAEDVHIFMRPFGSISGRALDANGNPLPFASVEAKASLSGITGRATADNRGEFRVPKLSSGEYALVVAAPAAAPGMRDFLPTVYADKILVSPGTHVEGIEIKLSKRGVRITGRFITDTGRPVQALARLVPRNSLVWRTSSNPEPMKEEFEIQAVAPGSYFLYAVTDLQSARASPQWVRIPIEVVDQNIDGISVVISSTGSIHGRIRLSPDATVQGSVDLSKLALQLSPVEEIPPLIAWHPFEEISTNGEFEYLHLSELMCFFRLSGEGWFISRLILEGRDVTSSGFSAVPGEDRLLEVVISNAGGTLSGFLKDSQDRPLSGARVILLPDRSLRDNPAFAKIALADDKGEFRIEAIAPGEYTAIAFPPEEQSVPMFLGNPQWVENYERYGERVQITAHTESRLDLVTIRP
jgi:protocatechuate 3,4-dioxygenase beta subunit